jgi:hypothetical protein
MKLTRKLAFLPPLLPVLLAVLIGMADRTVRADTAVTVEALHIINLKPVAGKFLNVFYVSAREAAMGISGQQLQVHAILAGPSRVQIPESGIVDLQAMRVPRNGFKTFNYLYLAITGAQPDPLFLRNTDGTDVDDPRALPQELKRKPAPAFQAAHTGFISAKALSKLARSGQAIEIDMAGKDVQR